MTTNLTLDTLPRHKKMSRFFLCKKRKKVEYLINLKRREGEKIWLKSPSATATMMMLSVNEVWHQDGFLVKEWWIERQCHGGTGPIKNDKIIQNADTRYTTTILHTFIGHLTNCNIQNYLYLFFLSSEVAKKEKNNGCFFFFERSVVFTRKIWRSVGQHIAATFRSEL